MGKSTLRCLLAWGPSSMQALRGQGLCDIYVFFFFFFFQKDFISFLERGEGREKERERKIDVQKKHREATSRTPQPGI